MRTLVLFAVALQLVTSSPVRAEEKGPPAGAKVQTEEGWYRIEPEETRGEPLAVIIVADEPRTPGLRLAQSPPARPLDPRAPDAPLPPRGQPPGVQPMQPAPTQPAPMQPPAATPQEPRPLTLREEIEEFRRLDCEDVRGRYLERLMELHGMSAGQLPQRPRDLGVWTRNRRGEGPPTYAQIPWPMMGDPALAPLYGLPPIPPGAIAWDFTLRNLAEDLLRCERTASPQPPPKYPLREDLLDQAAPPPAGTTTENVTSQPLHET